MKSTKDAMLPSTVRQKHTAKEALSGEAVSRQFDLKKVAHGRWTLNTEPFMLRQHTDEEVADYDKGLECGQRVGRTTTPRVRLGRRGWAEAQEVDVWSLWQKSDKAGHRRRAFMLRK